MIIALMAEPTQDVRDDQPLADEIPRANACPRCGSTDIRRFPKVLVAALVFALIVAFDWTMNGTITEVAGIGTGIVILLAILLDRYRCQDCWHSW
jgi:DNA-directed RNA polymerase subunit RPC12/RpoP